MKLKQNNNNNNDDFHMKLYLKFHGSISIIKLIRFIIKLTTESYYQMSIFLPSSLESYEVKAGTIFMANYIEACIKLPVTSKSQMYSMVYTIFIGRNQGNGLIHILFEKH